MWDGLMKLYIIYLYGCVKIMVFKSYLDLLYDVNVTNLRLIL